MSELLNNVRSRIESLGIGFQFVKTIRTGTNGAELETWLLEYEGSQFIFVPGRKHVTLGWDTDKCPLGDGVLEGLQKEFSSGHEYYYEEELEGLKGDYQEQIDEAEENGDSVKADELRSELAEELRSWNEDIEEKGYASWEGFLAKWNEHLSRCLSPLRTADIGDMIVEVDSRYLDEDAPSLEQAVLSLKQGIDNTSYTKGGDGGCSLCGGDGAIYVLPCYTAFYRHPVNEHCPGLLKNYFCYRRIIRLP